MIRTAVLALALSVGVAACLSPNVASPTIASVSSTRPTAVQPPAPTPDVAGRSSSPSSGTPRDEAAARAHEISADWVAALQARDYQSAWALLSTSSQTAYGSFDRFVADRDAFMASARNIIQGPSIDGDPRSLADWLPAAPGATAASAFVATVDYPALASRNNDQEILIVAPDEAGAWRIWVVR